jgi:hypothetical protein
MIDSPEQTKTGIHGSRPEPSVRACPHCSSPLSNAQEWCLECGTATTHIRSAPDWRIPVAVVGTVVVLVLAGSIVAISRLSSSGSSTPAGAAAPPPAAASAARPAAGASVVSRTAGSSGLVTIAEWPPRVAGWTVVLARTRSEPAAYAKATKLAGEGVAAGVVNSRQHPGWVPGYWFVFSAATGPKERRRPPPTRPPLTGTTARARSS